MIWGRGWGRDQHPQRSQNDKVIVQWERLEYSLHFPWHLHQWNVSVSGAETSKGCKSEWPIITYYRVSGFVLNTQMHWPVLLRSPLWKEMTEDTSFTSSFSWAFSLHKTAVSVLCVLRREWHRPWWSHHWLLKRPQNKPFVSTEGLEESVELCQAADFFFFPLNEGCVGNKHFTT